MKDKIDTLAYLSHAQEITPTEKEIMKKINQWLPNTIIDVHAHCCLESHIYSIEEKTFHHMISTYPSFSLVQSQFMNSLLHPRKVIKSLRFPHVFRGLDHRRSNQYLIENTSQNDKCALFGLHDDEEYTIQMLENEKRITALKMYYSYPDPTATNIYQFFTKPILEVAEKLEIPIILHPPIPILRCLDQVKALMTDFPKLKVCLAHLGLSSHYNLKLKIIFNELNKYDTVFYDTSMIANEDVFKMVLEITDGHKIMYGSDSPLNFIRAHEYIHPQKGRRLATSYPYHWVDKEEFQSYSHLAMNSPLIHWQSLNSLYKAIESFPSNKKDIIKMRIFVKNAQLFYKF